MIFFTVISFFTSSIDSTNDINNLYTGCCFPLILPVKDYGNAKFQLYHGTQNHK